MLTDIILRLTWRAFLHFFWIHSTHFFHSFLLNTQESMEQDLQCEADCDAAGQDILILFMDSDGLLQCATLKPIMSQLNPIRISFIKI
jgi:hypothetical protein